MASAAAAKKWPRLFQRLGLVRVDQPEVRLVDQGGGLERLAGLLLGQPLGGQLAQLVIDQRQELLGGLGSPCSMAERMRVTSFIAEGRRGTTLPRPRRAPEPRRSDRLAARPGTAWSPQDYPSMRR